MIYSKSMRDALQEVADYPEETEQLDESLLGLLRTAAIAVNVRNSVSSGKKVQSSATELRQIGAKLKRDKTPEDAQKTVAEGFIAIGELFGNLEEMLRKSAYISASGGLFSDRSYALLKKMQKRRR